MALFNSQLFWYFIQKTGYILRGGYFTFKTNYVSPFPLPNEFNLNSILEIEKLVKDIIHHKKNASNDETKVLEKKIDYIFYDMYNLTNSEVAEIEGYVSRN